MLSFGGREGEEWMKFDFLCASSHKCGPMLGVFSFLSFPWVFVDVSCFAAGCRVSFLFLFGWNSFSSTAVV